MESGPGMHDVLGLMAELFTWIGLGVGALFATIWFAMRQARKLWTETDAVIVGTGHDALLRWVDDEGTMQQRPLEAWELEDLKGADHCRVVHRRHRARLLDAPHPERSLGILAIVFLGLGMLAVAVSLALLLLGL